MYLVENQALCFISLWYPSGTVRRTRMRVVALIEQNPLEEERGPGGVSLHLSCT